MTNLGKAWIDNCRCNEGPDSTLENWLCSALNSQSVEIDDDGCVAALTGGLWAWVTGERLTRAVSLIESGSI